MWLRPSAKQCWRINSDQVFIVRPQPRPPPGLSVHVIWVDGCGVPYPNKRVSSSPGDLSCELTWSLMVTMYIQRFTDRSLCCRRCIPDEVEAQVSGAQVLLATMEHDTPDTRIWDSSSGGDGKWAGIWGWAGARWIYTMWHCILWCKRVHSRHPRMSSPQVSRRMAPPQASPFPLWPLTLVYHLLVWSVQYIVYI